MASKSAWFCESCCQIQDWTAEMCTKNEYLFSKLKIKCLPLNFWSPSFSTLEHPISYLHHVKFHKIDTAYTTPGPPDPEAMAIHEEIPRGGRSLALPPRLDRICPGRTTTEVASVGLVVRRESKAGRPCSIGSFAQNVGHKVSTPHLQAVDQAGWHRDPENFTARMGPKPHPWGSPPC